MATEIVRSGLKRNFKSIKLGMDFAVIYLISQKLVHLTVALRGRWALVATLTGITEVNPLAPAICYCPNCQFRVYRSGSVDVQVMTYQPKIVLTVPRPIRWAGYPIQTFLWQARYRFEPGPSRAHA